MRLFFYALAASALLVPRAEAGEARRFEDAALHAVQFADQHEGWAVGDEGVVWHTIDGGESWDRLPTGVRASLRGLHFLTPYTGWVVGREELPNGAGSVGVILFTKDGGLRWHRGLPNTMPGLNAVRFVDEKTGFVVGDGTEQFPSGIFTTKNGGRSWKPIGGPRSPGWLAAEFQDAGNGALVGSWSRLATLRDGLLGAADVDTMGGRSLKSLQVVGKRAVAVGQGGVVLLSESAGVSWGYADLKLPAEVRAAWDFHAVACKGDHVWAAGRPGSAVLHSADAGKTWEVQITGQPLPLNGLCFLNDKRGWAVGEYGSVLATNDGGQTWKVQRRGGQRAAVLFIHSRPTELPADTLARVGGHEGYLATAVRVHASDPASADFKGAADPQRWNQAVGQAGGAAGETFWQFPLPPHLHRSDRKDLLKSWDRLHGDRAAEQYLRQLVLALRVWRPAVVVTDHPDVKVTDCPADALLAEAVHEAFAAAADPKLFPEHLQTLGLEAWQATKLYACWPNGEGAQVSIDTTEISARLETTYRDFATPAASLFADKPTLPTVRFYRLLTAKQDGADKHRDLMEGVALAPGGTSRRELRELPEMKPDQLKALRERKNLETIAEVSAKELADPDKLLAHIGPALDNLPEDQASVAAFAVAGHYARMGQWNLAREVHLMLVDRYPAHPRAADSYRWLIRHNGSSEARRRHELGQFIMVTNLNFQRAANNPKIDTDKAKVEIKGANESVRERSLSHLADLKETRLWHKGSLEINSRLEAFGPLFALDPSIQFCVNAARRNLGEFEEAKEWYKEFRNEHADGPWREAAAAELWLTSRTGPCPKPLALCRQASIRPFLDGSFDDPCWQELPSVAFRTAAGDTLKEFPTECRLAYDKDFLYLALRCQHPEDRHVAPLKPRQRDADLLPYDRVSLTLDLDRDYSTYFHFQVDQRGCLCEDCWGDASWNPRWFVAVKSEKTSWQIEAAIPLTELTGDVLTIGKAWSCNVVRVIPGRGIQSLSLPADVTPRPEGMGILMFTPEAQKGATMKAN